MKTGPKPKCLCGEDKCRTCHARKYMATRRANLKRKTRLKQKASIRRSSKPIARKAAVRGKRAKPRGPMRDKGYRD